MLKFFIFCVFLIGIEGGGVQLGPLGTAATNRPIVPVLGDYDDGEIPGMMIGRGNRSTRRISSPPKVMSTFGCFPPRRPRFKPGSGQVEFCDGQKWRWGMCSPRTSVCFPCQSTFHLLLHNHLHYHPRLAQ
jgi:hypothetical protein